MGKVAAVRATGTAAINLAWTAAGRFDGYFEEGLQPWDIAAGMLMVREAGGYVGEAEDALSVYETGRLVAGNEAVYKQLRKIVTADMPAPLVAQQPHIRRANERAAEAAAVTETDEEGA